MKLSFLCFYWRIFPTKFIRIGCYIIGFLCLGWMISIQIVNLIQCRPLKAVWYVEMQALPETKCIDLKLFFLGNSIANCVIDLATVLLPIPPILKLHTSPRRRIGIAAIFLLGGMYVTIPILTFRSLCYRLVLTIAVSGSAEHLLQVSLASSPLRSG